MANTSTSTLGVCPRCRVDVPDHWLLIEYERTDGRTAFAECPSCRQVVRPVSV